MAILIVEDEADLADILSYMLKRDGHEVLVALDGDTALRLWQKHDPELVLLDLGLPATSGWDICRVIKSESETPIMILSGTADEDKIIQGLDLGVEDYVIKPFSPGILRARIRSALGKASRSTKSETGAGLQRHDLALDSRRRTVGCQEQVIQLTNIEMKLLQKLLSQRDQVVMHRELIEAAWGYRNEAGSKLVKGHILNLRKKLAAIGANASIEIVAGIGYLLIPSRPASNVAWEDRVPLNASVNS